MFVTLAGAMSMAELGLSLAETIRQDKVHGICCTGANLEEDLYNLVAHDHYERVPQYRQLTPEQEVDLLDRHLNRVTDTCIPPSPQGIMRGRWLKWKASCRSVRQKFHRRVEMGKRCVKSGRKQLHNGM